MDATLKPLLIPPEYSLYAEKHDLFNTLKTYMQQILLNKPDSPVNYLIDLLKKDFKSTIRVFIYGPPAVGKRSVARMISQKLHLPYLEPGQLIDQSQGEIRKDALSFVKNGKPLPPELWTKIIKARVAEEDCELKGFVLEAFPETREHMLYLQEAGVSATHFVVLDADDTVLLERASGKRIDPDTGDIYHTTFKWPVNSDVVARLEEPQNYSAEELLRRMVSVRRHMEDVKSCFVGVTKVFNTDQPLSDVFAQVVAFLQVQPRSLSPHNVRVALLGPSGSGKATQAAMLAAKYDIVNVSCSTLIKEVIEGGTKMGQAILPYVEKKMLIPDGLMLSILKERLSKLDAISRGWVLHGYPRSREQAAQLEDAGFHPNRVFFLGISEDAVIERLTLRSLDPLTGQQYHMLYNPPRFQAVKDRVQTHPRDSEESVRRKLDQWQSYEDELQDFYKDAHFINADLEQYTVSEHIEAILVNPQS